MPVGPRDRQGPPGLPVQTGAAVRERDVPQRGVPVTPQDAVLLLLGIWLGIQVGFRVAVWSRR